MSDSTKEKQEKLFCNLTGRTNQQDKMGTGNTTIAIYYKTRIFPKPLSFRKSGDEFMNNRRGKNRGWFCALPSTVSRRRSTNPICQNEENKPSGKFAGLLCCSNEPLTLNTWRSWNEMTNETLLHAFFFGDERAIL
jgi:hypothetical protein